MQGRGRDSGLFREGTRAGQTANCRDGEQSPQAVSKEGDRDRGNVLGKGTSAGGHGTAMADRMEAHLPWDMLDGHGPLSGWKVSAEAETTPGHASCLLWGNTQAFGHREWVC